MALHTSIKEELWFADVEAGDAADAASRSLAAKIAEVQGLKTFPVVAQRVLAILADSNFRVLEVTRALEEDTSLAAGVLRMANSALFATSSKCTSINQAFLRLGAAVVRDVVAAVATMGMFRDSGGVGRIVRDHCAGTAAIVQTLAQDLWPSQLEGLFLAGLMHDVGKLLLIESGESMYLIEGEGDVIEPDTSHQIERGSLGYDHAVLGGHVLMAWQLPAFICRVVAWHHQPERAYQSPEVAMKVALLRVADQIEATLRAEPEDPELFCKEITMGPDCTLAGIGDQDLLKSWDLLRDVRNDALSLFA